MIAAFVVAAPGLEPLVAAELAELGLSGNVVPGGVELEASPLDIVRINLWSRIATRVLVRLGTFAAENFNDLRKRAAKLPWAQFITPSTPLKFTAETHHCRLYHTGAIEENLRLAIGMPATSAGSGNEARFVVRGVDDKFTISIDSSGELLHRRGWRSEVADAPLRETLAAAILRLANYDSARPLVDLMCGTGAFVLEAAAIQAHLAPGRDRHFACLDWPRFVDGKQIAALRGAPLLAGVAPILGVDRDARTLASAERNLARLPITNATVRLHNADAMTFTPPTETGLVVANPPYGRRLGNAKEAQQIYRALGRTLRQRYVGWTAAIIVPNPTLGKALNLRTTATHRLQNGGLRVELWVIKISG